MNMISEYVTARICFWFAFVVCSNAFSMITMITKPPTTKDQLYINCYVCMYFTYVLFFLKEKTTSMETQG